MTMFAADLITLTGLVMAFAIFMSMALKELTRSRIGAVRTIKFQLAIATFVWLLGESLTVGSSLAYAGAQEYMQIHTLSMGIFALIIITRLPKLVKRAR
jgi:hypothetical protein